MLKGADTSRVATIVDPPEASGRSSKDVGRQLRLVRRKQGLSRSDVARSAGLTRRELAAYERGRLVIPESDLSCLAGSCGVEVNDLLPHRTPLRVGSDLSSLGIGDGTRRLLVPGQPELLQREYVSMVQELRNLPPGSRIPLREADLVVLADALGGTPDAIEARLMEIIGATREEATRLRGMILAPPALASALPSSVDPYASYGAATDASPGVDFFSAPRAQDPFSAQPSPQASPEPSPNACALLGASPLETDVIESAPIDRVAIRDAVPLADPFTPQVMTPGTDTPAAPDASPIAWSAEQHPPSLNVASGEVAAHPSASPFRPAGTDWRVGGMSPASRLVDDGGLALQHGDTRWALSDLKATGDFTIEAIFEYSAGAGFGVLFRASVDERERMAGYSFDIDPMAGDGGYLVRQWDGDRAYACPIVQAPMTDRARLFGRHHITVSMHRDQLGVFVDGESVLRVPALSRSSVELGCEPCRGGALGVHASAATEVTVETFSASQR